MFFAFFISDIQMKEQKMKSDQIKSFRFFSEKMEPSSFAQTAEANRRVVTSRQLPAPYELVRCCLLWRRKRLLAMESMRGAIDRKTRLEPVEPSIYPCRIRRFCKSS